MSDDLGPMMLTKPSEEVFLGMDLQQRTELSDETSRSIDREVKRILTEAYDRAKDILKNNLGQILKMHSYGAGDLRITPGDVDGVPQSNCQQHRKNLNSDVAEQGVAQS